MVAVTRMMVVSPHPRLTLSTTQQQHVGETPWSATNLLHGQQTGAFSWHHVLRKWGGGSTYLLHEQQTGAFSWHPVLRKSGGGGLNQFSAWTTNRSLLMAPRVKEIGGEVQPICCMNNKPEPSHGTPCK